MEMVNDAAGPQYLDVSIAVVVIRQQSLPSYVYVICFTCVTVT